MSSVALVGIDLGKHSFHICRDRTAPVGRSFAGATRQQMMRLLGNLPACTMVMEACAGSYFMARQLLAFGHEVKLISPRLVRPFVKGNKNDFIDAEAICEAASRPAIRFVTPKTKAQPTLAGIAPDA